MKISICKGLTSKDGFVQGFESIFFLLIRIGVISLWEFSTKIRVPCKEEIRGDLERKIADFRINLEI